MNASDHHLRHCSANRHPHGLAMVDLVITILIMGMAAAVAVPRFSGVIKDYQTEATARRLAAVLDFASRQSRNTSQPITLTFDTNADSVAVTGIDDPDHPGQPWTILLSAIAPGVDLTSASFDGSPVVTYAIDGRPNAQGALSLSGGGVSKTVTVSSVTGKAAVI